MYVNKILLIFCSIFFVQAESFAFKAKPRLPLVIYSEAFSYNKPFQFVPSGWMGDVHTLRVIDEYREKPFSGSSCFKFMYDTTKPYAFGWTGVCWQYPSNNWGNIDGGADLSGAKKLTFAARGETGRESISFKFGGNYGVFSDTTEITLGPITLSSEWKQYSMDLAGEDLTHISCGFGWVAEKNQQTSPVVIFYIDDIRIE